MIRHLVRFDRSGNDERTRRVFEASLEPLVELDEVASRLDVATDDDLDLPA